MDVREKLVEICFHEFCMVAGDSPCGCDGCPYGKYGSENGECYEAYKKHKLEELEKAGVTVQEWYSASNPPKEDGTYLVQTNTGTITTARFYAFKSFSATKYLPALHRSPSWQSNRNVVKWTFLPQPPKGE